MALVTESLGPGQWEGGERESDLLSSASRSLSRIHQSSPQAEEGVSGHTGPEAWPVLGFRRSRG